MANVKALIAVGLCALNPATALARRAERLGPSQEIAEQRGPDVFNAVHDAMRQWGSSVHHNGMSFFLATVPEGVLLHHGNDRPESPTDPDWLAYEIEHAESFARGRRHRPGPPDGPGHEADPGAQHRLSTELDDGQQAAGSGPWGPSPKSDGGWLHVYRTSRPLRFLYADGMSGGKTDMGTLDTQDYLLRGDRSASGERPKARRAPGGPMSEQRRAIELCELCQDWELQGVIRMEAGFEIIKCDFSDDLEQVQALQRPAPSTEDDLRGQLRGFEFIRGLSERYEGIGSSRTAIDYSSMVSAFFFPVNLTNPNEARPDLPRLSSTTDEELAAIKAHLATTINKRRNDEIRAIDWQDVSDLIVSRYADRLDYLANEVTSVDTMADEINFLLDVFIDYSDSTDGDISNGIGRCASFYLQAFTPRTGADRLIHAAFRSVTGEICATLFEVRELVVADKDRTSASLHRSAEMVRSLIEFLGWARFKRCPACGVDEACLIPMWPIGSVEDYRSPHCTNASDPRRGESYWGGFRGRPGKPDE